MEKGPIRNPKFDFLTTQCLVKIDEGQQKIKIVHTNPQSNLQASCQSIFSLSQHHPSHLGIKNQILIKSAPKIWEQTFYLPMV